MGSNSARDLPSRGRLAVARGLPAGAPGGGVGGATGRGGCAPRRAFASVRLARLAGPVTTSKSNILTSWMEAALYGPDFDVEWVLRNAKAASIGAASVSTTNARS